MSSSYRECIRQGTHIVFSGLPDVQRLTGNDSLRSCSAYEASGRSTAVRWTVYSLYDGLLLGGDIFYQAETEEEQKKQNLQLIISLVSAFRRDKSYI